MSDFEAVLERLLGDPGFQSALASDPNQALTGYSLSDEERELLHAQVSSGTGDDRTVEIRTTKSSMMGLFGSVAAGMGMAGAGAGVGASVGGGPAAAAGVGVESVGSAPGGPHTSGTLASPSSAGGPAGEESFGSALAAGGGGGTESFGSAVTGTESLGPAVPEATATVGRASVPPENYAPRIDVDGDGRWDQYSAEEGPNGGISIYADMDGDGRVDFVGHDLNRDGLVDSADYDKNFDGTFDQRLIDDDQDGWLDRTEQINPS